MRFFFFSMRGIIVLLLFLLGGCATLPATRPLSDREEQEVAAAFLQAMEQRQTCICCFDVQAQVAVKSLFKNGAIPGFLQARSPSFLKFVGVNPLGQPLVIVTTDGSSFRSLVVPEGKGYEGPVTAAAFARYAPAGFDPGHGFSWLTGSLPPRDLRIVSVRKDAEGQGYWLVVAHGEERFRRHLLFDAEERLLLRHLVYDQGSALVMDVRYGQYQEVTASGGVRCRLPGFIRIETGTHAASVVEMTLSDWLPEVVLNPEDFILALPPGVALIPVE